MLCSLTGNVIISVTTNVPGIVLISTLCNLDPITKITTWGRYIFTMPKEAGFLENPILDYTISIH